MDIQELRENILAQIDSFHAGTKIAMSQTRITSMRSDDKFVPDLLAPKRDWFTSVPEWSKELNSDTVYVDDEGRVAGWIAGDSYIIDGSNQPWKPPALTASNDKYLYQGVTVFDDGTSLPTTDLAFTEGHAVFPDWKMSHAFNAGELSKQGTALDDPERISSKVARVRYIQTPKGIAVVGALYPGVTASQVVTFRASAISGHWQPVPPEPGVQFLGAVFVNKPGLPLSKVACADTYAMVAAMDVESMKIPLSALVENAVEADQENKAVEEEAKMVEEQEQAQAVDVQADSRLAEMEGRLQVQEDRLNLLESLAAAKEMESIAQTELEDDDYEFDEDKTGL